MKKLEPMTVIMMMIFSSTIIQFMLGYFDDDRNVYLILAGVLMILYLIDARVKKKKSNSHNNVS